jgi:hypothetical protein
MIGRLARWMTVRTAAYAIKRGADPVKIRQALERSQSRQTPEWREGVMSAAIRKAAVG